MPELHVELASRRYPIHIESGLLRRGIAALQHRSWQTRVKLNKTDLPGTPTARERLAQTAAALGLVVPPQSPAARLIQVPAETPAEAAPGAAPAGASRQWP